jgi:hypothetical protein
LSRSGWSGGGCCARGSVRQTQCDAGREAWDFPKCQGTNALSPPSACRASTLSWENRCADRRLSRRTDFLPAAIP